MLTSDANAFKAAFEEAQASNAKLGESADSEEAAPVNVSRRVLTWVMLIEGDLYNRRG